MHKSTRNHVIRQLLLGMFSKRSRFYGVRSTWNDIRHQTFITRSVFSRYNNSLVQPGELLEALPEFLPAQCESRGP